jgi:hypothetical protein
VRTSDPIGTRSRFTSYPHPLSLLLIALIIALFVSFNNFLMAFTLFYGYIMFEALLMALKADLGLPVLFLVL